MSCALPRSTSGRTTIAAFVAATLTAILLALAPSAHAAKGMEVTIQDEGVFMTGSTGFNRDKAYGLLKGLQVSRMRLNASWIGLNNQRCDTTKPATPTYNFAALDQAIAQARFRGLKVLLGVTGPAPAWANKKKTCDTAGGRAAFNPNAKQFGKFAKLVATRYKDQVDQFSIWNEPNHKGWLQPVKSNGTIYRSLYRAGYSAIKKVSKKAKVFIGELAPYASKPRVAQQPLAFLRQLTCTNRSYRAVKRCPTLRADGFALHPYDFKRPPNRRYPNRDAVTIANLGSLTSALDKLKRAKRLVPNKGSRMNLYLTEYGYFATGKPVFSTKKRAKYLVQAFEKARRNKRVKEMLQFLLVQYPGAGSSSAGFNFDTSIVSTNGTPTKSYSSLSKWAIKAADKGQIRAAPAGL